jgi:hypothetical protein
MYGRESLMGAPNDFTGNVSHSILIPLPKRKLKWKLYRCFARYKSGQLMSFRPRTGEDLPPSLLGEPFTGQFSIIAVITKQLEDARVVSGKAGVVTFTVENGRFVDKQTTDVNVNTIEGLECS